MKALIRMRKLTAIFALLALTLALYAPLAQANIPGRPIDRPEGPPDPNPTEVGDPEQPVGGMPVEFVVGGQVVLLRVPASLVRLMMSHFGMASSALPSPTRNWRARNAR